MEKGDGIKNIIEKEGMELFISGDPFVTYRVVMPEKFGSAFTNMIWKGNKMKDKFELVVGPILYTVEQVDDLRDEEGELHGDYDSTTATIRLNKKNKDDVQFLTLLHEIFHIIVDHNAMELTEQDVAVLSTQLFTVLLDNGYLLSTLEEIHERVYAKEA